MFLTAHWTGATQIKLKNTISYHIMVGKPDFAEAFVMHPIRKAGGQDAAQHQRTNFAPGR